MPPTLLSSSLNSGDAAPSILAGVRDFTLESLNTEGLDPGALGVGVLQGLRGRGLMEVSECPRRRLLDTQA